ncbi:MAG: class II glutamine amidotransferase, partial [Rhizobiaceae bacterium]
PEISLINQSLQARMGVVTSNGDGFGMGWYDESGEPGLYRSIIPAWNDKNLRELAMHVQSSAFFAHVRASTGTAIQQTNCHPFRHGRWLWMHNGMIRNFDTMRRDLMLAVNAELFNEIKGSTDSEVMFYLALSLGLDRDPISAVAQMAGLIEESASLHSVDNPIRMSIATSDGVRLWIFRYASAGDAPSLFCTRDVKTLRELYPDSPRLEGISDASRLIVSEPLSEFSGVWEEIPKDSCGVVSAGTLEQRQFIPTL